MKLIVLSLAALILIAQGAAAQLVNGGFEEWEVRPEDPESSQPVGWTGSGRRYGSGKGESKTGEFAASVWNWYSYAQGILMLGSNRRPLSIGDFGEGGAPISFKPARLTGYYRYRLGQFDMERGTDSAVVMLLLKKFNTERGTYDSVGHATKYLMPAEDYMPFTVDIIDIAPGVIPDSIALAFISSATGYCSPESDNATCCYLNIDDLRLESVAGVSQSVADLVRSVRVYPNPVRAVAHVEWGHDLVRPHQLRICTLTGRTVRSVEGITGSGTTLDCSGLAAGEYFFDLRDRADIIAVRGRFVVE